MAKPPYLCDDMTHFEFPKYDNIIKIYQEENNI